jgi:hypothetical protein
LGNAYLVGWLIEGQEAIATYRLKVDDIDLSGLYTCLGQQFDRVV